MADMLPPSIADRLPDLPADWSCARLADVARILSGGTPSKQNPSYWVGAVPWASPKDLKRPYLYDTEDHISDEGLLDGSRLVPAGSLFVVIRGMILGRDIPISMAMVPMAFNQDMKAIVPNGQVNGEFLLHAFSHFKRMLLPEIGTSAHGTRRIGTSAIEDFNVPLPPLEEQQAISHVLRTVQLAKEATEKVIAAARQLKQSLMQHLFTFGPVPVNQADKVPLKETEIGPIPEHWKAERLLTLLREPLRNGHSARATNTDVGIRTLTLTAVTKNDFSVGNTKLTTADADKVRGMWLKSGDIYVERANTPEYVGLAALYEGPDDFAIYPDLMIRVRVKTDAVVPKFLAEFMLTGVCRRYYQSNAKATAGNFPKIDQGVIEATTVPLPPMDEQNEIAKSLKLIDRKINAETIRRNALEAMFRTLLHDLMIGKVRVNELEFPAMKEGSP